MFIAMNRFRITPGREQDFEQIWRDRESYLDGVEGFQEFHLVRGPQAEDHALYATHVIWEDRASFEAWTHSEQFKKAHAGAGANRDLYLGPPNFEGFDVILQQTRK
ncbi:MAG: antibiotic biosynthesis monooxygenase [Gammaproteobacteria bacterium]|nr:MAG: antibiotic biosynthesis monooxygenase [Gammaproteobacteria bacterium]RLA11640.1 MAG: antibiotic biosynthesis monooxygenase [Gammaproteobacteria bacterium]